MDIRIYHFYFLGLILLAMLIYCFLSVVTLTSPVLNYFYYRYHQNLQQQLPSPPKQYSHSQPAKTAQMKPSIEREKVLVDLFVMSRCPDAVVCERIFSEVVKEVNDIAIITTDYVANLNDSEKYGVTCKHGEPECIGNIQELCFRKVYPDQITYFKFLECLNQDISLIGTYNHAKKCTNQVLGVTAAATANITNSADDNYSKVDKCVNSKEGRTLLMKSVLKTTIYNVTKSCTMFINQKLRCIRDGYWYDCDEGHSVEDFVQSIRKAYEKLN